MKQSVYKFKYILIYKSHIITYNLVKSSLIKVPDSKFVGKIAQYINCNRLTPIDLVVSKFPSRFLVTLGTAAVILCRLLNGFA